MRLGYWIARRQAIMASVASADVRLARINIRGLSSVGGLTGKQCKYSFPIVLLR